MCMLDFYPVFVVCVYRSDNRLRQDLFLELRSGERPGVFGLESAAAAKLDIQKENDVTINSLPGKSGMLAKSKWRSPI